MIFSGSLQCCRLRHDFIPYWSQGQLPVCTNEENTESGKSSSLHHLSVEHQFSWSQIPPTRNSGHKGDPSCLQSTYTGIFGGRGEYQVCSGAHLLPVRTARDGNSSRVLPPFFGLRHISIPRTLSHLLRAGYHFKHFLYLILVRVEPLTYLS